MVIMRKRPSLELPEEYLKYMYDFAVYVESKLPFKSDVNLYLLKKGEKQDCTTGVYDPDTDQVNAVAEGRALADVLRTIAHEMTHKKQNDNDEIGDDYTQIGGFAEDEANVKAGNLVKMYVEEKNAHKIYEI